ncbi:MAG: DUF2974 domain-containing protein [Clostridia bacterium]|nr:DUF2974 domain-containing protein [Clostridia bacterium]
MANIFDYLKWRGDVSVRHSPFCEIDALILSEISYLDFSGIVGEDLSSSVTLKEAADSFFADSERAGKRLGLILPDLIFDVFRIAAQTRRFADMKLLSFISDTNESEEKQFSAMAVDTGDRYVFIAFRGTDDTIVGWREDFAMSYCDAVASQIEAKKYLDKVADAIPSPIRIGGHSKGGNLALYSALNAEYSVRQRISEVYNFDGPGFSEEITERENYAALRDRIFTFVPENSIVGMLLNHDTQYQTVRSSASGVYQHDGFTWYIDVNRFDILHEGSESNQRNDKVLNAWLSSFDHDKRREFTEALFELFEATGAKTLTDLSVDRLDKTRDILSALSKFDKEKRKVLSEIISFLIKEALRNKLKKDDE